MNITFLFFICYLFILLTLFFCYIHRVFVRSLDSSWFRHRGMPKFAIQVWRSSAVYIYHGRRRKKRGEKVLAAHAGIWSLIGWNRRCFRCWLDFASSTNRFGGKRCACVEGKRRAKAGCRYLRRYCPEMGLIAGSFSIRQWSCNCGFL